MLLELLLIAVRWTIDSTEFGSFHREQPARLSTTATCVRPMGHTVTPPGPCAVSGVSNSVADCSPFLTRWELASRKQVNRNRSEVEQLHQRLRQEFNGHATAAAESMLGVVDANDLQSQFDWQLTDGTVTTVSLTATPRDEVERLFYETIEITLDRKTGQPLRLAIQLKNQSRQTAWLPPSHHSDNQIRVVRFENEIPPSPAALIRTADRGPD